MNRSNTTEEPEFSLSPPVHLLRTYRDDPWPLADALEELVDNSLGEGRGNASIIEITLDRKKRRVCVFDNGAGMVNIGAIFTLGLGIGVRKNDSGRFGSGGTRALLSHANKPEVYTLRDGVMRYRKVSWDRVENTGGALADIKMRATVLPQYLWPKQFKGLESGTFIELDVPKGRNILPDAVATRLSKVFGVAIEKGRNIYVNGQKLTAWAPNNFVEYVNQQITLKNGFTAHLIAGTSEGLSAEDAAMRINWNYRFIKKTRKAWEEKYQGNQIFATLLLGDEWHRNLSPHKDEILNDDLCHELFTQCGNAMAELIAMMDQIFENIFELEIPLDFERLRGVGTQPGGPPKINRNGDSPKPSKRGDNPASRPRAKPKGEDKRRRRDGDGDKPKSIIRVQFAKEIELPGRTISLVWDGTDGAPLTAYLNTDSKLGQAYKQNQQKQHAKELLFQALASELARKFYTMGRTNLVLSKDEIDRVEASANGEAPVTLQGKIDRKIFEQLKTPKQKGETTNG